MKKRFWLIAAVLAVALFAGVVLLALPREPSYQGRRLTSWLEDLSPTVFFNYASGVATVLPAASFSTPSAQFGLDRKARAAIGHMGTNALPRIVQLVRREDSPLEVRMLALLKKQSLVKLKIYSADERRRQALRAMEVLGQDAEPAWKEVFLDEHLALKIRESALASLGLTGSEAAVSPLIACLSVTNILIRTKAAMLLSMLGHRARASIPALLSGIEQESDPAARAVFAKALRQCEPDIVLGSVRSLKYDPPTYRAGAAASLGMFKQHPEISIPALVRSVDDPEPHVREAAVAALGDFGAEARSATGGVLRACNDPRKYVRMAATNALRQIEPH